MQMSHEATTLPRGRAGRRLLGVLLGSLALAAIPAASASAQLPATSGDPRIGLASGLENAGTAALGVTHLANRPKPTGVNGTNSDMAIQGNYAFSGNFSGINIYDISNPVNPTLKTQIVCPASQNDVTVYKHLLFIGVETSGRANCGPNNGSNPSPNFRGVRIFDISNIDAPVNVAGVETCRGAHTLTLVRPKNDAANVYIYVMGTAGPRNSTELAGCDANNTNTPTGANPSKWRIEVIKVPLAAPATSAVVDESRLFANEAGAVNGLQNANPSPNHPCFTATPACTAGTGNTQGGTWSPSPVTDACHDITVYEAIDLAAGACEGNGLLIDISDPAKPKRIDAVADPLFAYWHGATFSNDGKAVIFTDEWGGGNFARCRATDQLSWGADAIYEIVDRKLVFRSYYKLPVAQTLGENCVSHVGNLVPVPGRNIMVQAWYQGGMSLVDFTDLRNPKEIGFWDRGPINSPTALTGGGFWSTYWHNGRIYASEIARGFDTFALSPTANLSAGEIAAAERVRVERTNGQSQDQFVFTSAPVEGPVGGNVPATLSLTIAAPASFGAFVPGIARTYESSSQANVISTAGDALLSVHDPSPQNTGHLVNGSFFLPQPLQARARNAANTGTAYNNVGSAASPLNLLTYSAPISNDAVTLGFSQRINANDALRTGTYGKTLTFTLSTTQP
jgi:hypothetical protein